MLSVSSRLAALGAVALAVATVFAAAPASAQVYGYQPGGSQDFYGYQQGAVCGDRCGDHRRYERRDYSYQGQRDVPGDYRCDAYWDRGRADCDARWRDQRSPWRRNASHGYRPNYGGGYGGAAAYYGEYGRPDVVYSGGGYGGYSPGNAYPDPYGHNHGQYAQGGRDPQRINWCCAEYRSYDPATGYYTAYSGQRVFCG